jgi:hypothetical protein
MGIRDSERARVSETLDRAIKSVEERIQAKDFKPTIAEFLKLVQLSKELAQDDVKEIRVTWVEPAVTSSTGK